MNKPVAFICSCVVGIGVLILGRSTFLSIAYGRGNLEAGNFNRCWYSKTLDSQTGRLVREWHEIGESTENGIGYHFNMWAIGMIFVAVGAGIYVVERSVRRPPDEF